MQRLPFIRNICVWSLYLHTATVEKDWYQSNWIFPKSPRSYIPTVCSRIKRNYRWWSSYLKACMRYTFMHCSVSFFGTANSKLQHKHVGGHPMHAETCWISYDFDMHCWQREKANYIHSIHSTAGYIEGWKEKQSQKTRVFFFSGPQTCITTAAHFERIIECLIGNFQQRRGTEHEKNTYKKKMAERKELSVQWRSSSFPFPTIAE